MTDHLLALAHHAYYCGEIDAGRRACERLLSTSLSESDEMLTRANRTWYTPLLNRLTTCKFQRLEVDLPHAGWSLFNPSLINHGGKLLAVIRSSNYTIVDGRYVMDGDVIRTENILAWLSSAGVVLGSKVLTIDYPKTDYPVDGLEDCRLRYTESGIGVSATIRNASPFDGRCRICTADVDPEAGTLTDMRVMASGAGQDHEKNWMPILNSTGGWLYACNHGGHVVTIDPDPDLRGGWQLSQRWASPTVANRFRGGTQLLPWGEGYLCVVHEVAYSSNQRVYEHRFVYFDKSMRLERISPAFAFRESRAIEFAAGIAEVDTGVMISFGVRDAEAWTVTVSDKDVEKLLTFPSEG